jgi:aryl sulfotransferase
MNPIVWLASFPKSGNTWLRLLIANLLNDGEGAVDINRIPDLGAMASARAPFDQITLLDSGLLTHDEADALRAAVYAVEAAEYPHAAHFVKVHDAYTLNARGEPLFAAGARGALYIVRDPRDVAVSFSHHSSISIDAAVDKLTALDSRLCGSVRRQPVQLRQKLLTWSAHVLSWIEQRDLPVHLVRYEDLKASPVQTFAAAMQFAGRAVSPSDLNRAVRHADFSELQRQEKEKGFCERISRESMFFRAGTAGGWRAVLSEEQADRIVASNREVMMRLGYLPESNCRDAKTNGALKNASPTEFDLTSGPS